MTVMSFNDAFNAKLRPSELTAEDRAIHRELRVQPDPLDHARDCHKMSRDMDRTIYWGDSPAENAYHHLGETLLRFMHGDTEYVEFMYEEDYNDPWYA
jgi:hypothetical protein